MAEQEFCIVKYAEDGYWEDYQDTDPKEGVSREESAHFTHTGKACGCPAPTTNKKELKKALQRMRKYNPSVGYAICKVVS